MIQPNFAPVGASGTYNNNVGYNATVTGNGNNNNAGPTYQGQNGTGSALSDGNGGQSGSMQQHHSESGQQSQQSQQPDYTLAGVLHFLQTEWRRYERDRNEWEIERAEMRARVALLEGERRSVENLKTDLMRRVKMLEFALRQERTKYLASGGGSATTNNTAVTPVKHPALQNIEKAMSSSGRSSPAPDPLQDAHQRTTSAVSTGTFNSNTMNGMTLGGFGSTLNPNAGTILSRQSTHAKDPKARAKSREYLKQCLQEISYLTSPSSLNPLPDRGPPGTAGIAGVTRPKKVMSEVVPPSWNGEGAASGAMRRQRNLDTGRGTAGKSSVSAANARGLQLYEEPLVERDEEQGIEGGPAAVEKGLALEKGSEDHGSGSEHSSASGDSDPLSVASSHDEVSSQSSSEDEQQTALSEGGVEEDRQQITAVFRPGGKTPNDEDCAKLKSVGLQEREKRDRERQLSEITDQETSHAQLQAASERVSQLMRESGGDRAGKREEEDLANLTLVHENEEEGSRVAADAAADSQMWKSKRVLRSHLDGVRAIAFDRSELSLYSASDDNTIKFWKLSPSSFQQSGNKAGAGQSPIESEPILTLRGHSAAVTSLAISTGRRRLYSGSVDSSIVVWKLADGNSSEPYPPYDKTMELTRLVGHTQAIWDLCLLPTKADGEGVLASVSADGTVKFWEATDGDVQGNLLLSFDYFGIDPSPMKEKERAELLAEKRALPVPTSIAPCMSDLRRCAVSFSNAVVKLYEVESGREVMQIASDEDYDGTESSQINKVLTHPTLPVLITGHENNFIKFFDINTGVCTLSMIAHLDSVTCLDIDPSGLTVASGGHDCSVRYWDYDSEKNTAVCVQEVTAHRKKSLSAEGVLQVKYHPSAPFFCSAGADGVIRIYG